MNNQEYAEIVLQELAEVQKQIRINDTAEFIQSLLKAQAIFVAGMGRSGYMARAFCMRLMHLGLKSYMVGDSTTRAIDEGDVLVICSGSGETKSLLSMAEKAKQQKSQVILLTINPDSTIAKLADKIVRFNALSPKALKEGDIKSIQPLGNLFEQSLLIYLDICSIMLMEKLGESAETMFKRHANLE